MGKLLQIRDPLELMTRIRDELDELNLEVAHQVAAITEDWEARRAPLEARLAKLKERYQQHAARSRGANGDAS